MFSRKDRQELGVLGLLVLAWGLLVAPVAHAFTHAHGHAHTHGAPSKKSPAPHTAPDGGGVEHLRAVATEGAVVEAPLRLASVAALTELRAPRAPALARWTSAEQPQGP